MRSFSDNFLVVREKLEEYYNLLEEDYELHQKKVRSLVLAYLSKRRGNYGALPSR